MRKTEIAIFVLHSSTSVSVEKFFILRPFRTVVLFINGATNNVKQILLVYFQPDISKFAAEILPLLFDYLGQASGKADPPGISRTYYALETFCENLGQCFNFKHRRTGLEILGGRTRSCPHRVQGARISRGVRGQ